MPYDKKTGKHYDYTKEGIAQYKKDTGKGIPYAPFKMKGHTLPGPNQNSALKISRAHSGTEFEETTEGRLRGEGKHELASGGRGSFADVLSGENLNAIVQRARDAADPSRKRVGSSIEGNELPQETQVYTDTGMDDSGADTLTTEDDTAKKKVDVEVTVNDKKI